ncbi:MAG TPA: cytochrome P450 [Ktedonobacteraceae bacterium]
MSTVPRNPIEAVTHPDPYTYYARLVERTPIYRDEAAGYWVVSSAAAVTDVLDSALCRVRPAREQVPTALLGSAAGEIFRHLVRMNDGQEHDALKQAVISALHTLDLAQTAQLSRTWASLLLEKLKPERQTGRLSDFAFSLPVYTIASLLGVPGEHLEQTARWMSDFVRCLAPSSTPEQLESGKAAANHLRELLRACLASQEATGTQSLLSHLARAVRSAGYADMDTAIDNGVGLISQSYEATAGLIGNTLLTLARRPNIRALARAEPVLLPALVQEVLRYDPPVHNTRRFLSSDGRVAGREMQAGEVILVLLAAANRDAAANPDPRQFKLVRPERRVFTFGTASHACPGDMLASLIAQGGIAQILASDFNTQQLPRTVPYRASANTRVPLFEGEQL